jgi:hypothetical protein
MADKDQLSNLKFTNDDIFNKYSIDEVLEAFKSAGFREFNYFFKKGYYVKAKK